MTTVADDGAVRIERLELGPFATNAYIVTCYSGGESLLVDAPAEADIIIDKLSGTRPRYILLTHGHIDHIGALDRLRARLRIPLGVHPADSHNLEQSPEISLSDGDTIMLGKLKLTVIHTPGHTPGSLCFSVGRYLLSGDTIFPGGPGSTGTPAAFQQIVRSISEKILVLPDDTKV
ncbi:MAG: MBL fold metallo-hydrolase, partial [Dehalococcoidia bacterium]